MRDILKLRRSWPFVALGFILGTLSVLLAVGRQVERLRLEREEMLEQLRWYKKKVDNLNETLQTKYWSVIQEVNVTMSGIEDEATKLALRREISPLLEELLGKELAKVEPLLILKMFDGREISLEEKKYRLTSQALVLSTKTRIVLQVEEQDLIQKDDE